MHRIPSALPEDQSGEDRRRRVTGAILGAALGVVYAFSTQAVNVVLLREVPLYQAPFGFWGNVLLGLVWGAMVGLVCAWPYSTAWGVALGSIASVMMALLRGAGGLEIDLVWLAVATVTLGTPAAVFMLPALFALRWAINVQADVPLSSSGRSNRLRAPLILLAVIAVLGILSLYPAKARAVLRAANRSLDAGLAAGSTADLPYELATLRDGSDFRRNASQHVALEWTEANLDRFIELRPANNYDEHSAVLAHFDNGNTLVCLYPTRDSRPNCAFLSDE